MGARAFLAVFAALTLAGCHTLGNDQGEQYLQRKEGVTLSAGDAKEVNARTHMVSAWPAEVGDRRIPTSAVRMSRAISAYERPRAQGGGGQGGGPCDNPGDIAADGSRCGGRAASEKPGGR